MSTVRFYYADIKSIDLKNRGVVKQCVEDLFDREGKELRTLSYIFCSDNYLLSINKNFLKHNYYTDIITFDLSEGFQIVGEVYISVERVKENASLHYTTYQQELLRIIYHGALHLCGYRDKKKSEITLMRQKEDCYLHIYREKF